MTPGNAFAEFIERYGPAAGEHGPERFVIEVLGADPDDWQLKALRAYGRGERQISIESCHGPGKTALLAWLILHQLCCRFPQKTACTAPASGQMDDALIPEVNKWYRKLPSPLQDCFVVQTDRIFLKANDDESFVSFRTARPEQPDALQGIHCDDGFVLLIADEGDGVPGPIYESALGSMSGHNCTTVLAGNPVRTTGFFYNANHGDGASRWFRIHVTAEPGAHCGEVQPDGQGSYVSKRVSDEFREMVSAEYGYDSNPYRVRVLGRPPRSEADAIILWEHIESATTRDVKASPTAPVVWGIDPARARTGDLTALAKRRANVLLEPIRTYIGVNDLMPTVGWIKVEWDRTPVLDRPVDIMVDAIGIGAGVADRLRELGLPARGINVSESSALNAGRFKNLRTELWFSAGDWFARQDCSIKKDEKLMQELGAQKYKPIESSGKVIALPKEEMQKYIHPRRSPDRATAFILTFASTAANVRFGGAAWKQPLKRNLKSVV